MSTKDCYWNWAFKNKSLIENAFAGDVRDDRRTSARDLHDNQLTTEGNVNDAREIKRYTGDVDWDNAEAGFVCIHQMKALPKPQFIASCPSMIKLHEMPIDPKCPDQLFHIGLCVDCAVQLLISTNFCTVFQDNLEFMKSENGKSNKSVSELERFRNIEYQMNLFVDIISIPSILELVLDHKQNLFAKCIRLLPAMDQFYRVYKGFVDSWMSDKDPSHSFGVSLAVFMSLRPSHIEGDKSKNYRSCSKCKTFGSMIKALRARNSNTSNVVDKHLKKAILCKQQHLHKHITDSVWNSHQKLERLMNVLYHRGRSLEFLESILKIDDGTCCVSYYFSKTFLVIDTNVE